MRSKYSKHINILQTGQKLCYDSAGNQVPCHGTGQDGACRIGLEWPSPRFKVEEEVVRDLLSGLVWTKNANPNEFPVTWNEALQQIAILNEEVFLGFKDWRLPNRKELRSLMSYQTKKPPLPEGHPFSDIFLNWYWTSTSAAINPAYAWYVHLEGARMFYGRKDQLYLFWPVRGKGNGALHQSGQKKCFDDRGGEIACAGSGQDAEILSGKVWPDPRFEADGDIAMDRLTGLTWSINADLTGRPVDWQEAFDAVRHLNETRWQGIAGWRLPNINELESLVDCCCHTPALPAGHPFMNLREGYWSSTTSCFETDWSWVLYMVKGACGVGYKPGKNFFVWPVS